MPARITHQMIQSLPRERVISSLHVAIHPNAWALLKYRLWNNEIELMFLPMPAFVHVGKSLVDLTHKMHWAADDKSPEYKAFVAKQPSATEADLNIAPDQTNQAISTEVHGFTDGCCLAFQLSKDMYKLVILRPLGACMLAAYFMAAQRAGTATDLAQAGDAHNT